MPLLLIALGSGLALVVLVLWAACVAASRADDALEDLQALRSHEMKL